MALATFSFASCQIDEGTSGHCSSSALANAAGHLCNDYVQPVADAFWNLWIFDTYMSGTYDELAYSSFKVTLADGVYTVNPSRYDYGDGVFYVTTNGKMLREDGAVLTYVPFSSFSGHLYTFTHVAESTWTVEGIGITKCEIAVTAEGANSIRFNVALEGEEVETEQYTKTYYAEIAFATSYSEKVGDTTITKSGVFDVDFKKDGKTIDWVRIKYEGKNSYTSYSASQS